MLCAVLALLALVLAGARPLYATVSGPLTGWAWSETIGLISFNCSNTSTCGTVNYSMTVDTSGQISGYAWSENIGWISANESDLAGCPKAPCRAKFTGNQLRGWMKALAGGTPSSGGWDGWISLNCTGTTEGCGTVDYGVIESNGVISGYAWGSDVVGWIDFSLVGRNAPIVSLAVAPGTITRGESATVTWSAENATSCTGTNFSTGGAISGNVSVSPQNTTTYGGSCTGDGGTSIFGDMTLTVNCPITYSCSGQQVMQTNAQCQTVPYGSLCQSPQFCSEGSPLCLDPAPACGQFGSRSGCLEAHPQVVRKGSPTRLYWNIENVSSCALTGTNGQSWNTTYSGASGQPTANLNQQTIFTLNCVPLGDNAFSRQSVTVDIVPVFQEK